MKFGRPVTLTLAAVLAVPFALTASPASAMIPEKDVNWSPDYSWDDSSTGDTYSECYYDHAAPNYVCNIPTDEPLVTQGTWFKAYADSSTFANPATVTSAKIRTDQGHEQAIPVFSTVLQMSAGDSSWVVGWKVPSGLNWDVEQDLWDLSGNYPEFQMVGQEATGDQEMGTFTAPFSFESIPLAPTSLGAKRASSTSATVTWQPPVHGFPSRYLVERVSSSGTWSTIVGADTRSFTFTHLTPGMTYSLIVQSYEDDEGNGISPIATAVAAGATTSLGAPSTVTAKRTAQGSASSTWSPPTSLGGKTITGYRVARDGSGINGGGAYSKVVSASTRSFTMTLLKLGSTYHISVQPVYSGSVGPAVTVPVFIG